MIKVSLKKYSNTWYDPGALAKRVAWYLISLIFFKSFLPLPSILKVYMLRVFGSKIGKRVVIKPSVSIKYPWMLVIGNDVWLGEGVWIDNLAEVIIGSDCCISQGVYICTGSHDWTKPGFDLITRPVKIEDQVWIAAFSKLTPGVKIHQGAVITMGSIASGVISSWGIHSGMPAKLMRKRKIIN